MLQGPQNAQQPATEELSRHLPGSSWCSNSRDSGPVPCPMPRRIVEGGEAAIHLRRCNCIQALPCPKCANQDLANTTHAMTRHDSSASESWLGEDAGGGMLQLMQHIQRAVGHIGLRKTSEELSLMPLSEPLTNLARSNKPQPAVL